MTRLSLLLAACSALPLAGAAELDPAAIAAWDQYVNAAQLRAEQRLKPGAVFLWLDESRERLAQVQAGEVVVAPVGPHSPKPVPSGLIHDWIGAVFIPNASLQDVVAVVRDYPRYREYFPFNVLNSKTVVRGESSDRSQLVLKSQSFFVRSSLDADYETRFVPLDSHRLYSLTRTTRIQEVEGYGSPGAKVLPEGEGTGVIWRLLSTTRYVERDGGVYVEMQVLALSRDIPGPLRWAVEPIVRRTSRASLALSLRQTENAVSKRVEAGAVRKALPAMTNSFVGH